MNWLGFQPFKCIKIYVFMMYFKNRKNLNDELFLKRFGFLVENRKLRKISSIYFYPIFLIYRLIFCFIPLIFRNKAGMQIISLIIVTLIYTMILLKLKSNIIKSELIQETFINFIFIVMHIHMLIFVDGGLTQND